MDQDSRGDKLERQSRELSAARSTSLTVSQQQLASQLQLTADNAKTVPSSELVGEFTREFGAEPPEALEWAFRTWRRRSPYFPAIAEIAGLLADWHKELELQDREQEQREQTRMEEEARASGQLVSFPEIVKQLAEIAKMPEPAPVRTRTVTVRPVAPALQLTREQIEARRPQERAEIERVRREMEGE
jgi:hypothetical protein